MRNFFLAMYRNGFGVFIYGKVLFLFLFVSACLAPSLPAAVVGKASLSDITNTPQSHGKRNGVMASGDACPTKEEVISKTRTLRMPFIANNGQVDGQVAFYAKTFGGTVFVTKDGEIVYSLPDNNNSLKSKVQGFEFAANGFVHHLFADHAHSPPDRVLTKALLSTYLPGLHDGADKIAGTRRPCPPRFAHLRGSQNGTEKHPLSTSPRDPTRGVALKEYLVGGKIGEIKGGSPAVTTVSYFKGNDPSKWRNNLSTYEVVDMGEVYNGIGLQLKAHGNNVEKLFTVKPGASPEQIRIRTLEVPFQPE